MSPAKKPIDESTYAGRFAARLRALREKTGMTGQQMAEAVTQSGFEVKWRTYHHWECGQTEPPFDALPALAKALGKSIRTLMPEE